MCFGEVGSEECFKVIKKFTENGIENVMLFSNYNLKLYADNTTDPATITYKQDQISPDTISFIFSNIYWHDTRNNSLYSDYSKNINGKTASYSGNPYPYIYNSNSRTHAYVEGYVSDLKTIYETPSSITGRLLTNEEASDTTIFADNIARNNGKSYWLGSAESSYNVRVVFFNGVIIFESSGGANGGVRSVIIVPTADL